MSLLERMLLVCCLGQALAVGGSLQGAALSAQDAYVLGWTAAPMAENGADFRTDGTLVYAYSMDGGTVNGIPFESLAHTGFTSASNVGVSPQFNGTKGYGTEGQTGDFAKMLDNCWYWNQPSSGNTASYENSYTVTLRGLESGKTYLVQLLAHRRYVGSKDLSIGVGDAVVVIGYSNSGDNSGPNGEYYYGGTLTGIIKATDVTQDITVTFNGEGACKRVLNAIQVRELPVDAEDAEPAQMFYVGETGYDSWTDLAKVLKAGDVVRLGTDAETPTSAMPPSIAIDLNGHTLSVFGWWANSYVVTDTGKPAGSGRLALPSNGLNIKNGSFDLSALDADQVSGKLNSLEPSTVQVFPRNMTLAEATSAIMAKSVDAMIVVKGVTYTWDGTNWTSATSEILPAATAAETRERIQDAIDAAALANPIGTVELGAGIFEIDAQLMVTGGVTLVGQGWEKTVLKQISTSGLDKRVLTVDGGARVEKVTLTGGMLTQVSVTGANWKNGAGADLRDGTISWCCISNNASLKGNCNYGGGVVIGKGRLDHSVIADNRVTATTGNAATGGGIAIRSPAGPVTVDTCLVYGNSVVNNVSAGKGGGIGIEGLSKEVTVCNTTIVGNSAGDSAATSEAEGGAVCSVNDSKWLSMVNCVIADNVTAGGGTALSLSYSAAVDYCLFGAASDTVGAHSLVGDPKFADAEHHDYRLTAGSPAIGAGTTTAVSWTDLDNVTYTGVQSIGCYGYGTPLTMVALTVPAQNNMSVQSVLYDGKRAVRDEQGAWLVPADASVTVTFVAATGYELTGNPVQVTLGGEAVQTLSVFPTATKITLPADDVTLTKVAEYGFSVDGCGGIAYAGHDNLFYVLQDHDSSLSSKVYPLTLGIDMDTAAVTSQTLGTAFTPGSNKDSEGIVYDSASGALWISDEYGPTIAEFGLDGTATGRTAPVPEIVRTKVREGTSLESLALSPDGLTMWTANEQALSCDGEVSSGNATVKTVVRLVRFTRATPESAWVEDGQWAYACDACAGSNFAQSGVSGLCALPDGSLLVLEREVSASTWGRCRIYRVTPYALDRATEVSSFSSLADAAYAGVMKGTALVEFKGAFLNIIVYEGITLGPKLKDGSYSLYLVSDGGETKSVSILTAKTVSRICALKLRGLQEPGGDAESWDVPGESGGINAFVDAQGRKTVRFTSVSLANGKLTLGLEAAKVDANGQTFGLVCKESLTDKETFTLNVTLTDDGTGSATIGTLEGLVDKPQLFILGIGPAK